MRIRPLRTERLGRPRMLRAVPVGFAAVILAVFIATPASANNILPTGWSWGFYSGTAGVLRPGSPWAPAPAPAWPGTMFDGSFLPEQTQWDDGSFWWDQDPSVNASLFSITLYLNQTFTIYDLTIQADNNDTYRIEYWDGSAWQVAWDAPPVMGWGLMTRTSPTTNFTTDQLRFSGLGGDNYFAISEVQASNVPEPTTLALLGAGLIAAGARRRRGL